MIDPAIEPERRGAIRTPSSSSAIIGFSTGAAVRCDVRNASQTGARLHVVTEAKVPDDFLLWIDGDWPRRCHVVWRRDEDLGVAFRDESAPAVPLRV
jgi:methyl-accepting chemotaxis protein